MRLISLRNDVSSVRPCCSYRNCSFANVPSVVDVQDDNVKRARRAPCVGSFPVAVSFRLAVPVPHLKTYYCPIQDSCGFCADKVYCRSGATSAQGFE